jgi:hypothetical protein
VDLARGSSVLLGIPICTDCSWWDKVKKKEKIVLSACSCGASFGLIFADIKKTFPLFSRVLVIIMSFFYFFMPCLNVTMSDVF